MSPVAEDKDVFRAQFDRFAAARSAADPAWLREARTAALARFAERGFPKHGDEDWKYTNVAEIARTVFARPAAETASAADLIRAGALAPVGGTSLVFVNGRHAPELGTPGAAAVRPLAEMLARDPARLQPLLARQLHGDKHAFAALNTAFLEDGAFVELDGVSKDPIHLIFLSVPGPAPSVSYPRIVIAARGGSETRVVENYVGHGSYLTSAVTEVVLEDGARLDHLRVQRESSQAFHISAVAVRQGRDSRYACYDVELGAGLARTDIDIALAGAGAECELLGLFLTAGSRHTDLHTRIDHAVPHCTSRELVKGIVSGRGRGVFHGRILVRPGAQKTDAHQANKNLLLSREALVQSTPQLEILADDVKCKHGSTTGQLDAAALFYLRSRGLDENEARRILTRAFASEIVERLPLPALRESLEPELRALLGDAA